MQGLLSHVAALQVPSPSSLLWVLLGANLLIKLNFQKYLSARRIFPSVRSTMKIHSKHFSSSGTSLLSQMLCMSPKSSQELSYRPVATSERAVFCQETRKLPGSGRLETFNVCPFFSTVMFDMWYSFINRDLRMNQQILLFSSHKLTMMKLL